MNVCGQKIKIIGDVPDKGKIAFCTYLYGDDIRVTPINGDPLVSISLNLNDVKLLDIDDCQCFDEFSYQLNQCNECPR